MTTASDAKPTVPPERWSGGHGLDGPRAGPGHLDAGPPILAQSR
jgi:hypothetical protein